MIWGVPLFSETSIWWTTTCYFLSYEKSRDLTMKWWRYVNGCVTSKNWESTYFGGNTCFVSLPNGHTSKNTQNSPRAHCGPNVISIEKTQHFICMKALGCKSCYSCSCLYLFAECNMCFSFFFLHLLVDVRHLAEKETHKQWPQKAATWLNCS